MGVVLITACTEPIQDPPAPDISEFVYQDCNDQEFAIKFENYYDIFWFGRYYTYQYKGIQGNQYYFYDGGPDFYCSYDELIELIEKPNGDTGYCWIKLKK